MRARVCVYIYIYVCVCVCVFVCVCDHYSFLMHCRLLYIFSLICRELLRYLLSVANYYVIYCLSLTTTLSTICR